MAAGRRTLLALLFLLHFLLPEAFKILILSFIGGSHYLMMDEISNVLHNRGHEVRMLLQTGVLMIPGLKYKKADTYQITAWSANQDYLNIYEEWFDDSTKDFLMGREDLSHYMNFMKHLAYQCHIILNESETLNSLKDEKFDITVIDGFNPCSFLVAEKLGLPFAAVFPGTFVNGPQVGIPSPLSYVPVFHSHLTDRMDFWGRVKNCLMSLVSIIVENQVQATFENVIKEHFTSESRTFLSELYWKAELWIYNTDFSLEFARPLLPNTVYIGGLLAKPAKLLSQELEDFIANSEDGFIIVTLGSMLSSIPHLEVLQEINAAFACLSQSVIWRFQHSKWPKELKLAPNVKIADWLPQNDLLGILDIPWKNSVTSRKHICSAFFHSMRKKDFSERGFSEIWPSVDGPNFENPVMKKQSENGHPMARLLVTHGGMNSLMESIYHGVPVVGIPLFGDQYDNMVRVEAKKMGIALRIDQLTTDKFTRIMKQVIEDKRYKSAVMSLSAIHHSHPLPPDQRLVRWIEHILQVRGGAHLQPYGFQQSWCQQYLLDVVLFLSGSFLGIIYFCVKLLKSVAFRIHRSGKQKQT